MENEFMKRGYLLPEGCKDLSDVAKLKQKPTPEVRLQEVLQKAALSESATKFWQKYAELPPMTKQVFISPPISVRKLAALLDQKPFQIIADFMQLGIWVRIDSLVDFKAVSAVVRKYGFEAIKAG